MKNSLVLVILLKVVNTFKASPFFPRLPGLRLYYTCLRYFTRGTVSIAVPCSWRQESGINKARTGEDLKSTQSGSVAVSLEIRRKLMIEFRYGTIPIVQLIFKFICQRSSRLRYQRITL